MRRLLSLFAGAVLVAGAATSVAAQPPAGGPPGGPMMGGPGGSGGGMQRLLFEGITLTDAQRASVDSILAARRAARQAQMPQGGGPPDEATRAAMRQGMEQDRAAMRALLTADQQKTFDANVARLQERQRQRMQAGPGGGPGGPGRGGRD